MYKTLKKYKPDTRDPEVQKKELIQYFQKEFFENKTIYSISKAMHDKNVTAGKYAIYRQCAELNVNDVKKTLDNKAGTFKNDYSKMVYILIILKNHIADDVRPAEPHQQKEPPAPTPQSTIRTYPCGNS